MTPSSDDAPRSELRRLFDLTIRDYRTRCFWNVRPRSDRAGLKLISTRLRRHGDMRTWRLASEIGAALDGRPVPVPPAAAGYEPAEGELSGEQVAGLLQLAVGVGVRDAEAVVELARAHRERLPLWHVCWAAVSADSPFTPVSLVEWIGRMTPTVLRRHADRDVAQEAGAVIRSAVSESRDVFPWLPVALAGRMLVEGSGWLARTMDDVERCLRERPGGAVLTNPRRQPLRIM